MRLLNRLLLSAPALIIAGAAYAADLPANKSAPIQYVRVCDAYGSGFFFIPGTDTCLRVGGYVRLEAQYTPGRTIISPVSAALGAVTQVGRAQDETGREVRGRIDLDARTQTEWGTVQTAVSLRATNTDGIKNLGATSSAIPAGAYAPAGNGSSSITLERAFIRFAGLTAGVSSENFTVMPGYMYTDMPYARYPNGVKQLAYTATFGSGFSATLAIESRGDINYSNGASQYSYDNRPNDGYDLVGNVRYDAAWGFAQLSGAVGENTVRDNLPAVPNSVTLANAASYNALTGASGPTGFAVGGTVRINLPMLAAGDQLHLNVAYADGLLGLVGCSDASSCTDGGDKRFGGGILRFDQNLVPVAVNGPAGTPGWISFGQTRSWAVGGIYTHYWTPTWRSNLAAGYQRFIPPTAAASAGLQLGDANLYMIATNLIWSPTKNFDIGVEIAYYRLNQALQNAAPPNVSTAWLAAGQPGLSTNNFAGKLRLERQF